MSVSVVFVAAQAKVAAQTAVAPALILIVELLVPALMWIEVRTGCAFGAFFHWMIAITPPPNDIGTRRSPPLRVVAVRTGR